MIKSHLILFVAFCALALASPAQDTNVLKTNLGIFEAQTGVVIIKGRDQIGSITVGPVTISVRCKESTDISTGRKADGLDIELAGNLPLRDRIYVDYDEIDSLLNSINYLNKITSGVTPLPGFEACYSTKAGLRVVANSVSRQGVIQNYLEYDPGPRIPLSSIQMSQLSGLIEQAKKELDALQATQ